VAFVVADAELVGDQLRHARTGPQRSRKAVRFRAFKQQRLEPLELGGVQQRLAAGASGFDQTALTLLAILPPPFVDRLARDLQPPGGLGLVQAFPLDQPNRFEAALLQRLEIAFYAFGIAHIDKALAIAKRYQNILRDSVSRL